MKNELPAVVGPCIDAIADAFDQAGLYFGHGTDNPGSEAQWLVSSVLTQAGLREITRTTLIPAAQGQSIAVLLQRRLTERVPLAYLLNEAWFAGHCFYVDERVLVPRSPLAETIGNDFQPFLDQPPATVLDLCCGSGCIGIACALANPACDVVLADLSEDALAVAQVNIERFGLQDRVSICQSDLFEAIIGCFDLILCNPPYVPAAEYHELPPEYLKEPAMGLVCEDEGLAIPLRVLRGSARHLAEDGVLILETGYTWPALEQAMPALPFLWLDFEYGGQGVCVLKRHQLQAHFPA